MSGYSPIPCNLVCRYLSISRYGWLTHSLLLYAFWVYISVYADSFMFSFFFPPVLIFPILCTFRLFTTINSFGRDSCFLLFSLMHVFFCLFCFNFLSHYHKKVLKYVGNSYSKNMFPWDFFFSLRVVLNMRL